MNAPTNGSVYSSWPYPARARPILLGRGVSPKRTLFLIHDGTGGIEGYFKLCARIRSDFSVYGILCNEFNDGVPQTLSIPQLSRDYIGRIAEIQPSGPYYLAGWSIGGTITFEMASQLEAGGHEVAFCGLFDPPPPGYYPAESLGSVTLQAELEWLSKYAVSQEDKNRLAQCRSLDELWRTFVGREEEGGIDSGLFRRTVADQWQVPMLIASKAPFREWLCSFNTIRSLHAARTEYEPDRYLASPVHLFAATGSPIPELPEWGRYCKTLKMYPLQGDHYSIFDHEHVESSAVQLNAALPE
ncbi:thioesterase domain-containing protein [Paenibacillus durus]|uniref:Thioesterase domain-containing protein n=2 Tax=Paenibacillus durus TaxID=44251 RepID=A0A0F7FAA3_PAEDU|nr:thioesterase domain-containing protein [Paenibacillus durus]AKG35127.1 hypothetical protein VK70_11585 [Paenibacillus durus ATCC 35681]